MGELCLSLLLDLQRSGGLPVGRNFNSALTFSRPDGCGEKEDRQEADPILYGSKGMPGFKGKQISASPEPRPKQRPKPFLQYSSAIPTPQPSPVQGPESPCTYSSAADRQLATPSYRVTNRTKSHRGKGPHTLAVGSTLNHMFFQTTVKTLPSQQEKKWVWHQVGVGKGP